MRVYVVTQLKETDHVIIIEAIKKKIEEIITNVKNQSASTCLQIVMNWVSQDKIESKYEDILHLLNIITTIHAYLKKKFSEEDKILIENFLCIIIAYFSKPSEKILSLITSLNKYIKAGDKSDLDQLASHFSLSNRILDNERLKPSLRMKMSVSFEKIKHSLIDTFEPQQTSIPIAALSPELMAINSHVDSFSVNFILKKTSTGAETQRKIKKRKIKTRIIDFDDEGIGYDIAPPYLFLKEVKRLAEISLDIELSSKMKKRKMMEEELTRFSNIDVNEVFLLIELEKKTLRKIWLQFATKAEKENRQRVIEESIKRSKVERVKQRQLQKIEEKRKKIIILLDPVISLLIKEINVFKEHSSINNNYLSNIVLPFFERIQNDFAKKFIGTIDYANFRGLINSAEEILISINEIEVTLKKMDKFSESFGFSQNYFSVLGELRKEIKEIFCRNSIGIFFENSLELFRKRTLNFENNYCLLRKTKIIKKIAFSEPVFLNQFISNNSPMRVFELISSDLKQFFSQNVETTLFNTRYLKNKDNFFKLLLYFFSGKYYFLSQNYYDKFAKKFILNIQQQPDFDFVKSAVLKLKWWHFILAGINPFHIFKKKFKELLAKEVFLNLIEEEFEKLIENQSIPNKSTEEACSEMLIKYIDHLYSIQDRIRLSNISDKSEFISLVLMGVPQSRQTLIENFNNCEDIKKLLNKVSVLASNARTYIMGFSRLLNLSQMEIGKFSNYSSEKSFFTTPSPNGRSLLQNHNASNLSNLAVRITK